MVIVSVDKTSVFRLLSETGFSVVASLTSVEREPEGLWLGELCETEDFSLEAVPEAVRFSFEALVEAEAFWLGALDEDGRFLFVALVEIEGFLLEVLCDTEGLSLETEGFLLEALCEPSDVEAGWLGEVDRGPGDPVEAEGSESPVTEKIE